MVAAFSVSSPDVSPCSGLAVAIVDDDVRALLVPSLMAVLGGWVW
jgi:hypothetical protein